MILKGGYLREPRRACLHVSGEVSTGPPNWTKLTSRYLRNVAALPGLSMMNSHLKR